MIVSQALLYNVLGVDVGEPRTQLAYDLLRPAVLLALLQAYRYCMDSVDWFTLWMMVDQYSRRMCVDLNPNPKTLKP